MLSHFPIKLTAKKIEYSVALQQGIPMKRIFYSLPAILIGLSISACSDGGDLKEQEKTQGKERLINKMSGDAQISAEANITNNGRILVFGKTNLPDNTELSISLSSEDIGFYAQDDSTVNNGEFTGGPLGPESGLIDANYIIDVTMPVPSVQPNSVQSIVGSEGQHLSGPLINDSSWGKTVEYTFTHRVGSNESIQNAKSEHAQTVSDVRSKIEQLLRNGREMERYRNSENLTALKTCGKRMRENQAKAETVRSEAEKLPMRHYDLRVASIDVHTCVSCSKTATETCDRVQESLNKAEQR